VAHNQLQPDGKLTTNRKVLMLPGDGIGPEVMHEVSRIIDWMNDKRGAAFDIQVGLCGGAAYDAHGKSLTDETMADAMASDAVLFGSVGGPKWDDVPREERPEAGLLRLRKEMDLFANLRLAQERAIGAQGSSIYMQKAISASKIAEMESFLTSIDSVSDYLDSDEIEVLEQIARLGTMMNYLPGTARVMALRDMSYKQRKDAYKNMIDEMLEFGVRDPSGTQQESTLKIGPIEIGKSEPLNEVAELLEHLADTLME